MAANRKVQVVRANGHESVVKAYAKTGSTAMDGHSLVEWTSGLINPADDNDVVVVGVLLEEVATTDADYTSSTATKLVELIQPGDEVEMDTTAAVTVGTSYGISNAYTVDASDTTNDVFLATQVISSTRARGFLRTVAGSLQ